MSTKRSPWTLWITAVLLSALLIGCAFYNKLTANLRSENFNIARSLVAGQGYTNAIGEPSGPTAWSAPGYPIIQAGLFWAGDGDRRVVVTGIVILQMAVLCGTGFLVLAVVRRTTTRIATVLAGALFFLAICFHFSQWFQVAQDCWLMLLMFSLLIAGICWLWPMNHWPRAAAWGACGGLSALVNPSIGFAWGVVTLAGGLRGPHRRYGVVALVVAGLVVAPWTIRNYLVFGRLIPIKSNAAYEMYQSQCLQPGGLLQGGVFQAHPSHPQSAERQEYKRLGEATYLDRKSEQFWRAVQADPLDFIDRLSNRFLAATVWYAPFYPGSEIGKPLIFWARRIAYPLPFLAMLFLLWSANREQLAWPQWAVIGVYLLYLLPYIVASYYERYTAPLVGVKVLLLVWAADRLLAMWPLTPAGNERECIPYLAQACR
jgi:hypothetical protein